MTPARNRAVVLAALVCGAGIVALVLSSDRNEPKGLWAAFSPLVLLSFSVPGSTRCAGGPRAASARC